MLIGFLVVVTNASTTIIGEQLIRNRIQQHSIFANFSVVVHYLEIKEIWIGEMPMNEF